MQKRIILLLTLFICLSFSACSQASQVENHAYVLIMGLDQTQDGQIKMTVKVPKISSNTSENENASSANSNYIKFAVVANNYEACLEKLDWASPRDLNLSQIKLIVLSRQLAESSQCRAIVKNIAQTERLYTATKVTVCDGNAAEFVSAIEPKIGMRMSMDINAMFEHYVDSGYVPESSLAELFYQTESIYSDPMVSFALLENSQDVQAQQSAAQKSASALSGDVFSVSKSYDSDILTRFLGACVFVDGEMKGVLSGTESIIAGLMRNEVEVFHYECDEQNITIVPARPVYVKVDTSASPLHIKIDAKLSVAAQENLPNMDKLRTSLTDDIYSTIEAARKMGAEPFGFAEQAAKNFLTMEDWRTYNWKQKFADAEIEIDLSFAHSDA